jgi:DNA-binding LytR/AlgR family response regulator
MTEELDVLRIISERLRAADVPFMLTGSFALGYYGKPRMTRDLDFVVAPMERHVDALVSAFSTDFYIDEDAARSAREPPADLRGLTDLLKNALQGEPRHLKWLTVPKGHDLHVVAVADIAYLRADNKYTTIATRSSSFLCTSSLKEMKDKLDPNMFWQIHRSVIVNVGAIETIYRSFRGALELKLKERGELLPVSAAYAHLFKQR